VRSGWASAIHPARSTHEKSRCPRSAGQRLGCGGRALPADGDAFAAGVGGAVEHAVAMIDLDCGRVTHEVAPAVGDFNLMAACAQGSENLIAEAVLDTQGAGRVAPGTAIQPTRIVDGGLHVVVEVHI